MLQIKVINIHIILSFYENKIIRGNSEKLKEKKKVLLGYKTYSGIIS